MRTGSMRSSPLQLLLQKRNDSLIVFGLMREHTAAAALYQSVFLFYHYIVTGTVIIIQRTIAEKAVDIRIAVMAWIVLAILICKKLT